MTLTAPEKNAFEAIRELLKVAKVRVTATTLRNVLLRHTEFPLLTSLSDVLKDLKVDNLATRLDPQKLTEIPLPAIAHFDNGMGYVTITKIEDNTIEWWHNQAGIRRESIAEFSQKWRGVTLLVQPNEGSGEVSFAKKRRKEIIDFLRVPFALLVVLGLISFSVFNILQTIPFVSNWQFYALLFSKLAGTIISMMLVWYSIDANNSFLRSVCEINSKTNCGNILNSNAAKIFGWLTWSEVGLFYFGGGLLTLLIDPQSIGLLKIINVLALPYTLWSVYYQWRIAKEWCVLCLCVQALSWIEFYLMQSTPFTLIVSLSAGGLFMIPALWALFKKPLQSHQQIDALANTLQKLKFDPEYVQAIMSKERVLPPIFEGMKIVEIGNPDAENTILFISSPSCASCSHVHGELLKLVESNHNFKMKILFAVSFAEKDPASQVSRRILSLPEGAMEKAVHLWYENIKQDIAKWSKKIGIEVEMEGGYHQIAFHHRWLELAGVTAAPAIFLNNVEFTRIYGIHELEKICKVASEYGFANQR
jgi:uncharacterized membrane protein